MIVNFGKHKGKSVGALVLKEPAYIAWVLSKSNPSGPLGGVKAEAQRLIRIFNSKPIATRCYGSGCGKPSTRCTVYMGNVYGSMWWCDDCDPYQSGAIGGKLQDIRTYENALTHCDLFCSRQDALKDLIKTMAQEKGLPKRVGEKQTQEFFST